VWDRLHKLSEFVDIHVLTADTRGTATEQLGNIPLDLLILPGDNLDDQKRQFAAKLDLSTVAAFGNGANDRLLLKAVKAAGGLAVAVENGEGCATEALSNAHILIFGAAHALDLLADTDFLKATLRF
jgi:soluble P-type ATPase